MKYMNIKKKYQSLNLQLFAENEGGEDENGGDSGEGDDQDDDDSDENGEEEKKFSQKDVDDAVKKRIARERRKWQREQHKAKLDGNKGTREDNEGEDKETQDLRERAAKADDLELKWTCLEHDVDKSCVDDVLALAKVHMSKDKDLDIEDAIDKVLKKYPQFKENTEFENEENNNKAWGQRQSGRGSKKMSGVEQRFYDLNPDLRK